MKKLFIILLFFCINTGSADDSIPTYGARYLYKKWDCKIKGDSFKLNVKIKLVIYNSLGENYNSVVISENRYSKIKNLKIKLFDKNGKEIYKRNKKDMTKACGYGSGSLYNDICTYYISLSAPQFPYIIEYEYTEECKSLFFWRGAWFQEYIPVDFAGYKLTAPSIFKFKSKIYGLDINYNMEPTSKGVVYSWTLKNIPELEDINYLPPDARERGRIDLAAENFKLGNTKLEDLSWKGIGIWHNKLAYGDYQSNFTSSSPDALEKVRYTYNQIINDIRYVAIEIGIGGWKPYKPALTKQRGFGDCKDMATLLISELKKNAIKAQPVFLLTRNKGRTDVDFPKINFNHVIAMSVIGNDTVWMDPTCNNCTFGELPWTDEDIDVLVVDNYGGTICRTPKSTPFDNRIIRTTNYFINNKKYVDFTIEIKAYGNYALKLRGNLENLDKDEEQQFVNKILDGAGKVFKIKNYNVKNIEDINAPVIISMECRTIKPVDLLKNKIYFNPFMFSKPSSKEKIDLEDRIFPVSAVYPYLESDIITVKWDSVWNIDSIIVPPDDSLNFDFGMIKRISKTFNNSIEITFDKAYNDYSIPVDRFSDYQIFCDKLKKLNSQHIKLVSSK